MSQSCTYTDPGSVTLYQVSVDSSGNFNPTSFTLKTGDQIKFTYTSGGSEAKVGFTPSSIAGFTLDSEKKTKTVTFSSTGTWTMKVGDKNGNTGTVVVQ